MVGSNYGEDWLGHGFQISRVCSSLAQPIWEWGIRSQQQEESSKEKFLDRNTMLGTNMQAGPNNSEFQGLQNSALKYGKDDLCKRRS
jgi:hypothetical protein